MTDAEPDVLCLYSHTRPPEWAPAKGSQRALFSRNDHLFTRTCLLDDDEPRPAPTGRL